MRDASRPRQDTAAGALARWAGTYTYPLDRNPTRPRRSEGAKPLRLLTVLSAGKRIVTTAKSRRDVMLEGDARV